MINSKIFNSTQFTILKLNSKTNQKYWSIHEAMETRSIDRIGFYFKFEIQTNRFFKIEAKIVNFFIWNT